MRVMYLSVSGELGGAERSLLDILSSLRQAQPSWTLRLVTSGDGPLLAQASAVGVTTSVLPLPSAFSRIGEAGVSASNEGSLRLGLRLGRAAAPLAHYVRQLRREVHAFGPDILHTNSLKMHILGAWAAPSSTAIVWHLHDYISRRRMTTRLLRMNRRRCAAVVANSVSVAEDARHALGKRVPILPVLNAVDLQRFSAKGDRLDLDSLAGLPPAPAGVVRVGLVGTFARWKGHTTFLDAIALLPPDLRVRAYIVGGAVYQTDGSQHTLEDLRLYAARVGVDDRVGFTGFVARPEAAIRALDIVVHASTECEPFGLVIAEAMACERAVIASDAGGAREIFTAGVDALGHAPGSAADLAAHIVELARDGDQRIRIGRAGRRTAERRFDRSRLASDLVPVYQFAAASL
jgi:glycosyltransferase involved in cell wall biosynthesis